MSTVTTYRITFDRIGRSHTVPPISVTATEGPDVAQIIARHVFDVARGRLVSHDVNVTVELGTEPGSGGTGMITAGFHNAGTFTVTPTLTTEN